MAAISKGCHEDAVRCPGWGFGTELLCGQSAAAAGFLDAVGRAQALNSPCLI